MRGAALVLLLAAAACAEVRQAPTAAPPAALARGTADPVLSAIAAMPPAFTDRARALAGHPAEAAQAAAELEYVTAAIPADPRYAPIQDQVWRELVLARQELRDALGVAEDGPPDQVVRSLLAAAAALRAGDRARAAAALPAPLFRPGGARSVARLGELGPLPQGAIATALAQQEVARIDAGGGWLGQQPRDVNSSAITDFGAGSTTVGY